MRKRFWPSVLRVTDYHWRWHVNDWARVVVKGGTVLGTRAQAMIYARRQADRMEHGECRRIVDN